MRTASLSPCAPAQSRTNAATATRAGATPAQSAAVRLRGRFCDGLRAGGEGPRVSCEDWAVVHLQGRGCRLSEGGGTAGWGHLEGVGPRKAGGGGHLEGAGGVGGSPGGGGAAGRLERKEPREIKVTRKGRESPAGRAQARRLRGRPTWVGAQRESRARGGLWRASSEFAETGWLGQAGEPALSPAGSTPDQGGPEPGRPPGPPLPTPCLEPPRGRGLFELKDGAVPKSPGAKAGARPGGRVCFVRQTDTAGVLRRLPHLPQVRPHWGLPVRGAGRRAFLFLGPGATAGRAPVSTGVPPVLPPPPLSGAGRWWEEEGRKTDDASGVSRSRVC